ncbi:MAG: SGNH/GDSL hydrolase family protein [Paludibacter sp.]|nr:SGNH/GDSL hydrolase family protein [Paludibacter sp.]
MTTRRDFIKKAGLLSLAAMSLPELLTAANNLDLPEDHEPSGKGLTILFQGDSITDGNRTRNTDWNHVMGHGYGYLIASRLWYDYPHKNLMFYNRGISGNRVKDLETRWQKDTLDLKPDVISILVGVNDIGAVVYNQDPETIEKFEERYIHILEMTKAALPGSLIVLCEPFILPLGRVNEKTETWQAEVKKQQAVVRKLAERYHCIFVELQEPFRNACKKAPQDYWIWDGIHPMPAGHELIARAWIKEVRKKLTFIKG